jgi:hypothetical protein
MMEKGFVYVLTSPNSECIKIGGTKLAPAERIRGINSSLEYGGDGPWGLSDFLHVKDWRLVEGKMHSHFKGCHYKCGTGARELFRISALAARKQLLKTLPTLRIGYLEKTTKLRGNHDLEVYLHDLFERTGLYSQYDIQGAWTLCIFPATGKNGRYFTINIGRHEVAFSILPGKDEIVGEHYLIMDSLINEYRPTIRMIKDLRGQIKTAPYKSAGERAVSVSFYGDLALAQEILKLPGVGRALIAYWHDRLSALRINKSKSLFARFHDYDAAYELLNFMRARENVFTDSLKN